MKAEARNVLLILCDQLRADFLAPYGGPKNATPNISRLAESGVVFDKAYSVMPVCTAARMTMLTGMHPATCPVRIPESVPTLTAVLSDAGFHTAAIGKMHMSPPRGPYGFNELILAEDTGPGMFLDDFHPWCARQGFIEWPHGLDNFDLLSVVNPLPEERTVTRWTGDHAVRFLERQDASSPPFYAVVSFTKPHPPYDPPLPWADLVKPEEAPLPLGLERPWNEYPKLVRLHAEAFGTAEFEKLGLTQQTRAYYLGLVAQVDHEAGRILRALAERKLGERTLVIFCSDHGDFLGDHHLFMKFFPYEAAARVPLIVCGPGIAPGTTRIPVSHLDLVPTVLDFCGLETLAQCQGNSLLDPHLQDRGGVLIETCFGPGFCWATPRHKYTFWPNGEEELFDLAQDPTEIHNLAGTQDGLRAEMREALIRELSRLDGRRVGGMPPLLQDGDLIETDVTAEQFKGLAGRFLQHRIPRRVSEK